MYDTAIQIRSGTRIDLPTSQRSTSRKKNEVSYDPIGAYLTDRKILSRQNQSKSSLVQRPRNYQITKKFVSRLLIYSIRKNSNWLYSRKQSPQQKSHRSSPVPLAEKTSYPP